MIHANGLATSATRREEHAARHAHTHTHTHAREHEARTQTRRTRREQREQGAARVHHVCVTRVLWLSATQISLRVLPLVKSLDLALFSLSLFFPPVLYP